MGDENIKDIPLNIDWWLNNYNILTVDSIVNKYNILDKDYSIRLTDSLKFVVDTLGKDNITTSLEILKSDENNKRELYTPNNRRANKKRLLENR